MNYCFNKDQIEKSLEYFFKNNCDDHDIIQIIENSKQWFDQITILNFIVTQIIQKKIKKGNLPDDFVQRLYSLPENGDIIIDEIDEPFIEFMFTHLSISNEIIENLIYFKNKLNRHDYRDQICH
jgi:hypothetical protein